MNYLINLRRGLALCLVFVTLGFTAVNAQTIEDQLRSILKEYEGIGVSVGVVKDNKLIYNQSVGLKNREDNTPLGNDDIFRIASISKSFSVVAIMQLIEQGKVTLDTDVNELLRFPVRNPKFPDIPITVRMLISHTSSMNDSQRYGNLNIINPSENKSYAKSFSDYAPGTDYRYCNLNFNMMGAIIEGLSGQRFDVYIKENILDPLDLYGGFNIDSLDSRRFARIYRHDAEQGGYTYSPRAYARPGASWMNNYELGYTGARFSPTGGMKISAKDLTRYMMMHMNLGVSPENGNRVMSAEHAKLMHQPHVEIDDVARYGFGIRISDVLIPGLTMTGHTGSAHGLVSSMFFNREEGFGIVVINNGSRRERIHGMSGFLWKVNNALYDHFIKVNEPSDVGDTDGEDLADQVVIRRTQYGVPHIHADNMKAAAYAMGYLQLEDYGVRVLNGLIRARGDWARNNTLEGAKLEDQIDTDAANRLRHQRAAETFDKLDQRTKDLLEGYAEGVNRYIEINPSEFSSWVKPDITAIDVHTLSIGRHSSASVKKFLDVIKRKERRSSGSNEEERETQESGTVWATLAEQAEEIHPEEGSNVWALAPSRTTSGRAILMRNPHLTWYSGYYEAHMIVKDEFNFYGDFRVGQPLGIVGGFNQHLGWSTTNNYTDNEEIYAFPVDKDNPGHYILDGKSFPLIETEVAVEYKDGNGQQVATRKFHFTEYGPVVHQSDEYIYIVRAAHEGEYRTNQQFLRMMASTNLEEWKDAMRMQARSTSNFTYADREGNIFYVWNAAIPNIKHPSGNDTEAVYVTSGSEIWSEIVPWDDLPQLLNPKGGYLRNENDPFQYTNLNEVIEDSHYPDNFPEARLRLRSQLSLQLIGGDDKLSLEEVVERKHDMTALLADRVKDDLIAAVRKSRPSRAVRRALKHLEDWNNTVAADSRGGILFESWWGRYQRLARDGRRVASTPESAGYSAPAEALFAVPWSKDAPATTPYGLGSPNLAAEAFEWAIKDVEARFGSWNLAWGDVHRARIGSYDYPVGGASGNLGVFRVLWYRDHVSENRKREVRGGDCWVFAVEFGEEAPRAYTVVPYGQSRKPSSPYYADQLKMFAENEMKPISFTEQSILDNAIKTYRPGK